MTEKTICHKCHREFEGKRRAQRFCSAKCRRAAWADRHPLPVVSWNADGTLSIRIAAPVPRSGRF